MYDENQDDEDQISTLAHMEFYSSKSSHDNYKSIEKGFKEHISTFTYEEVYNTKPVYDVYEFFNDESQNDILLPLIIKDLEVMR
jgi:hypothetical protein